MRIVRSLRFRIAIWCAVLVFVLGGLTVAAINVVLSRSLDRRATAEDIQIRRVASETGAAMIWIDGDDLVAVEHLSNTRALERLGTMSLILLGVLFPASLVTGWFVAGRVLRPVDHIANVAMGIQASDLSRRIRLEGPDDELKHLADAFDGMLDRIEEGVEDQRRFIQDVSHELRNPLATMAASLDLVLAGDTDPAALRSTAESVRRSVDRASLTVDGMARFARRELPNDTEVVVDLGALIEHGAAEVGAAAGRRRLTLVKVGDGRTTVRGDRQALTSAMANLLGNAIRMAPEGSAVRYGCGVLGEWAWAGVADAGPGIHESDHRLVFQRAWSRDRSRLHHERRTGLGLSIVRQVAEAAGGTVTLTSRPAGGSSFVIWLPKRSGLDPSTLTWDGIHPIEDPLVGSATTARQVI
ncbi:MAG: HAMP domain-containing sensor histidine kinase [Acidimicrobiia bacterium]